MAIALKQSTASQEIPLGYFLDSSDGDTEETGLTIANTDIKLWKNGATTLANKNSGGATHISNGVYYCTLDATDTDTLGPLIVFVHVSGALAIRVECVVLAANVYDSLIAASDALQVHATEIDNDLITAAAIATGAIDADAIATDAITAAKIAANAITTSELADGTITAAKVATGAIDADAIATDAITAAKIAANAITTSELADGTITAAKVATGAIDADALAADAVDEILDEVVEGTLTMRQVLRIMLAALAGKSTGGGTTSPTFRDNADSKARISATVDASGNRTAVSLDGT